MHIVTAFETAVQNKYEAQNSINALIMRLMSTQEEANIKLALELTEINNLVSAILYPFVGE